MAHESAYTSVKIIPKALKHFPFRGRNLDFGGGKWETATTYLRNTYNCENLVVDPYNRDKDHNEWAYTKAITEGVDSITCLNVLNVCKAKVERELVIENIYKIMHQVFINTGIHPIIIFQVYEGDKTANKEIQTCMKSKEYIPEIREVFPDWSIEHRGNIIVVYQGIHSRDWNVTHPYVAV